MNKIYISTKRQVSLDGMMTIGMLENGLKTADFMCCEDISMEAFSGTFKVEVKRDGNVYMTERPKRVKNKPLFREDNCSLSHGRNGRYYFVFSLDEDEVGQLPQKLTEQANNIASKMIRKMLLEGGENSL